MNAFASLLVLVVTLVHFGPSDSLRQANTPSDVVYCESTKLTGSDISTKFSSLRECHVIEGHLILSRGALPERASLPNLTQVTDYIILERVQGLVILEFLFPALSVIRGENPFLDKFSLILHSNLELEHLGVFPLLLQGAVHIQDNILLCTDEDEWSKYVRHSHQGLNFFDNNRGFCPFLGCEEEGYCRRKEKVCSSLGLPCAAITNKNCSAECIGGCYEPFDSSSCVACKYFEINERNHQRKCINKCPKRSLLYLNYRCLSHDECLDKNFNILDPKDVALLDFTGKEKILNKYKKEPKCLKTCPEKFISQDRNSKNKTKTNNSVKFCKLRKVCETTTITNENLGDNMKYCEAINGNLVILVSSGKNVTRQLEANLKKIERVSGYIKVVGANALYSLSFLSSLKTIGGEERVNGDFSLYIVENSNLEELWDWDFRSKNLSITGSVYIHFNDRLCDSEIAKFKQVVNIKKGNVNNDTNGNNALCSVFETHLKAVPGSERGTLRLTFTHCYCAVDARYVYGYQILYRAVGDNKNISKYQERDVCHDKVWLRNLIEVKNPVDPTCIETVLRCLTPNTRYAIYVQSISDVVKHKIESNIVYATTYLDNIEKPSKGRIKPSDNGLLLSYEPPRRVPNYIALNEIFYEIILTLYIQDEESETETEETSHKREKLSIEKDKKVSSCPCTDSHSKDIDLLKEQKRESIAIENEISGLIYRRPKNVKLNRPSKNVKLNQPPNKVKRSLHNVSEERNSCDSLKFYPPRYTGNGTDGNILCLAMKSNSSTCNDPEVDWSSSSTLAFKKSIFTTHYRVLDAGKVYVKSERTQNTSLLLDLPLALHSNKIMPKRISVQIRACVGEIRPCTPLQSNESCSTCSEFLNLDRFTVDNKSVPSFEVKLWQQKNSNTSGHKLKMEYSSCSKTSFSTPTTYIYQPYMDVIKKFELDDAATTESPVLSFLEPSANFIDFVLGYTIIYHSYEEESAVRVFVPKSIAEELGNHFKIPLNAPLEKLYVGFQVHYQGGLGRLGERCLTISLEVSQVINYFICLGFIGLGGLFLAAFFKFYKKISNLFFLYKLKNMERCTTNDYYCQVLEMVPENFRLSGEQLIISNEVLGSGHFGKVYKGTVKLKQGENSADTKITKIDVAVKVLVTNAHVTGGNNGNVQEIVKEAAIMSILDSFFVVKFIGLCEPEPNDEGFLTLKIAMEFCEFFDLKNFMTNHKDTLSEQEIIEILCMIAGGMKYLHGLRIIHCDLAMRNCLVKRNPSEVGPKYIVKFGDFGLARRLIGDGYVYIPEKNIITIPPNSAPEMSEKISWKIDVYSFGVVIREILKICTNIKNETTKQHLLSLMERCLEKRPHFEEIVDHLCKFVDEVFVVWFNYVSRLENGGSNGSTNDSSDKENDSTASTFEPCDDDDACLDPKNCSSRNESSCMALNCVHNNIFCRKKQYSNSEIDDLSFR
nr:insulin-like receptor 1 [Trichorhina tomentosa]